MFPPVRINERLSLQVALGSHGQRMANIGGQFGKERRAQLLRSGGLTHEKPRLVRPGLVVSNSQTGLLASPHNPRHLGRELIKGHGPTSALESASEFEAAFVRFLRHVAEGPTADQVLMTQLNMAEAITRAAAKLFPYP